MERATTGSTEGATARHLTVTMASFTGSAKPNFHAGIVLNYVSFRSATCSDIAQCSYLIILSLQHSNADVSLAFSYGFLCFSCPWSFIIRLSLSLYISSNLLPWSAFLVPGIFTVLSFFSHLVLHLVLVCPLVVVGDIVLDVAVCANLICAFVSAAHDFLWITASLDSCHSSGPEGFPFASLWLLCRVSSSFVSSSTSYPESP